MKTGNRGRSRKSHTHTNDRSSRLIRRVWIVAGTLFMGLGALGIFLPLLPTTPFLLLAAACYSRGSKRFYNWLVSNRWFGNYIKNYRERKALPLRIKAFSILLLWATVGYSTLFVVNAHLIKTLLFGIAIGVTIHIALIRTLRS